MPTLLQKQGKYARVYPLVNGGIGPAQEDEHVRILIIDDSKVVREFMGMFLRQVGHEVATAADLATALPLLDQAWDVGIIDIEANLQPVGLGYARELMAGGNPKTCILYSTEESYEETAQEMHLGFWHKHGSPTTLLTLIEAIPAPT